MIVLFGCGFEFSLGMEISVRVSLTQDSSRKDNQVCICNKIEFEMKHKIFFYKTKDY